jgi:L-histidine Nalpha-methyltransferase
MANTTTAVQIDSYLDEASQRTLADDALDGLTRPFQELPPKHFYDGRGSELFDRICELPEYYPTRTERAILAARATEIAVDLRPVELVELGSGSATKTRVLLDAMSDAGLLERYVPLDVSETVLRQSADLLVEHYEGLRVHGVVGDFERHLDQVPPGAGRRLVVLLGGTIGNFPPGARRSLLRKMAALLQPGDRLLLGTDLVKDPAVIEAAYNDAEGVTAAFNGNVLHVLNRELGADFEPDAFEHVAFFDRRHEWMELRLRARRAMTVDLPKINLEIEFEAGEELRTEISAKFTRRRLEEDLEAAGLALASWFTDPDELFAVSLSEPAGQHAS